MADPTIAHAGAAQYRWRANPRADALLLCGCHLVVIGCLYLYLALGPDLVSHQELPTASGWVMLALIGWIAVSWVLVTGTVFSPYLIMLASATAFNGGQVILSLLGILGQEVLKGKHDPRVLSAAILYVSAGLAWSHLGALVVLWRVPDAAQAPVLLRPWQPSRPNLVRVARVLALVAMPAFIWYANRSLGIVLRSGYIGIYRGEVISGGARYIKILGAFLVPAALYLVAASQHWRDRALGLGLLAFNSLLWLMVGSRGELGGPALAFLWLWDRRVRRIPVTSVVIVALVMIIGVFPMLGAVRMLSGAQKFSGRALELASQVDNPAVKIFTEMGASLQVLAFVMEAVPSRVPHDYGLTYLEALSQLAPVSFEVRPTLGHWITPLFRPFWYARGGGLGGSFYGEVYYSFGWIGMPLFCFVIGLGLARTIIWAERSGDPAACALVASFLAAGIMAPRNPARTVVRVIGWFAMAPYAAAAVLTKLPVLVKPPAVARPAVSPSRTEVQ